MYVYIYIYRFPLGAFKSQLGGPIFSLLVYIVIVSCDLCVYIYIRIYTYVFSSYHLIAGVSARKMHSTTKFAMTVLSKCVTHAGFVMVA